MVILTAILLILFSAAFWPIKSDPLENNQPISELQSELEEQKLNNEQMRAHLTRLLEQLTDMAAHFEANNPVDVRVELQELRQMIEENEDRAQDRYNEMETEARTRYLDLQRELGEVKESVAQNCQSASTIQTSKPPPPPSPTVPPCNCQDIRDHGATDSGVYTVYLNGEPVEVYCDMDTAGGGWLVFQRRVDASQDFYLGWDDYKTGFGSLTHNFWLGNNNLHAVTNSNTCPHVYELRVDLGDYEDQTAYAVYNKFSITAENDNYRLSAGTYSGTAGDGLNYHLEKQFSTKDRDNDLHGSMHCARDFRRGAWWYNACAYSNLNGVYGVRGSQHVYGVRWRTWRKGYSLKFTEMKIRPTPKL